MGLLKSIFGPSQRETVWRELAQEIGGQYHAAGWYGDKMQFQFQDWTITLDVVNVGSGKSSAIHTRLRAPYVNAEDFRFTIYRKSIFSGIGKWLGMQDIEIGAEPFDEDFIIKGNNEDRVREFFADETIRDLIRKQPQIRFEVTDDEHNFRSSFPDGVDELCFLARGTITDLDVLKGLFMLFGASLHRLCQMGSAYEDDPGDIN